MGRRAGIEVFMSDIVLLVVVWKAVVHTSSGSAAVSNPQCLLSLAGSVLENREVGVDW